MPRVLVLSRWFRDHPIVRSVLLHTDPKPPRLSWYHPDEFIPSGWARELVLEYEYYFRTVDARVSRLKAGEP